MRAYVFLHGFLGDKAVWDEVRARLPAHLAVVPTLLGHTPAVAAASVEAAGSFAAEVERIAALLDGPALAAADEPPHLVGYSLGARVALGLLARQPSRFARVTLIGVNPGLRTPAERNERADSDERWAALIESAGLPAFLDAWEAQPLFSTQRRLPASVLAEQRARRLALSPAGLVLALRRLGLAQMPDFRDELARVPTPIELVVGEHDEKFRTLAAQLLPGLARGRLTVVPGVGHNVVLEDPAAVAAVLTSAL